LFEMSQRAICRSLVAAAQGDRAAQRDKDRAGMLSSVGKDIPLDVGQP
jgi:hypothetical protein